MIVLVLNSGLRLDSKGFTLLWDAVDLRRTAMTTRDAYANNAKSQVVKVNTPARETLLRLQAAAKGPFVFSTKHGQPYKSIRTVFDKACAKAACRTSRHVTYGTPGVHGWARRARTIGRSKN